MKWIGIGLGVLSVAYYFLVPIINGLPGMLRPMSAMLPGEILIGLVGAGFVCWLQIDDGDERQP